jgi:hypothetical protein
MLRGVTVREGWKEVVREMRQFVRQQDNGVEEGEQK